MNSLYFYFPQENKMIYHGNRLQTINMNAKPFVFLGKIIIKINVNFTMHIINGLSIHSNVITYSSSWMFQSLRLLLHTRVSCDLMIWKHPLDVI